MKLVLILVVLLTLLGIVACAPNSPATNPPRPTAVAAAVATNPPSAGPPSPTTEPTQSPTNTAVPTNSPSVTPSPSLTATSTRTETSTSTVTPTATDTLSPTPTATSTKRPTRPAPTRPPVTPTPSHTVPPDQTGFLIQNQSGMQITVRVSPVSGDFKEFTLTPNGEGFMLSSAQLLLWVVQFPGGDFVPGGLAVMQQGQLKTLKIYKQPGNGCFQPTCYEYVPPQQ